ncbi:MAG: hypothetical protein MI863_21235 [Desulfobacterales bacterium]|nr:hypothetical protein [Desulfobacterales bacterium]
MSTVVSGNRGKSERIRNYINDRSKIYACFHCLDFKGFFDIMSRGQVIIAAFTLFLTLLFTRIVN